MSNYVLTPQAVRKLRGALAATPGNSGAAGAPSPVNIDDFPPPFTVRWSASARNKRGAWVIWLPDASSLVYVGNAYVSQITNIVAEVALPAGWYRMSPVSATTTAVWLIVRTYTLTGAVQVYLGAYPGQPQTGYTIASLLVATMETDAQTGAKRVKQYVDSAVVLGGEGGGAVALDDVSTDFNGDSEVQIKDWDTGTPASSTTIAQDIKDGGGYGTLVERDSSGELKYKSCGTLEQLLGSTVSRSSQKILTGLRWDTSSYRLVISSANITVANGVITSWTDNNDENIDTTPWTSAGTSIPT